MSANEGGNIFETIPETGHTELAPSLNAEEFSRVVESRRSVRVFDGTPIPEDVVRKCLDLALLAPSSSNLQPWEFYWVRTASVRKQIVTACFSQPAAGTAAELIVCVARTGTWRANRKRMLEAFAATESKVPASAMDYYKRLVPMVYTQGPLGVVGLLRSAVFFGVGLFRPVPREPGGHAGMRLWATKSCALACENLMLAFRAFGFDSCPMEGFDSRRVRALLSLPRDAEVVMIVGAGRRAANGVYGPRMRFAKELFIREV